MPKVGLKLQKLTYSSYLSHKKLARAHMYLTYSQRKTLPYLSQKPI
jgi:hypothetical protein